MIYHRSIALFIIILFLGGCDSVFGQAPGNTCSTASLLTVNGSCGSGNASDNTESVPLVANSSCIQGSFRREGWYYFSIPVGQTYSVTISANNTSSTKDLMIQLCSGSCGSITEIACANSIQSDAVQTESITNIALTSGIYYIKLSNIGTSTNAIPLTNVNVTGCQIAVPGLATSPTPANASSGASPLTTTISWNAPASSCGAITYDVYFGTTSSPSFVGNSASTFFTVVLAPSTSYYWKVVPKNSMGDAVGADTWQFTTGIATYPGNISTGVKIWYKTDGGLSIVGSNVTSWSNQWGTSSISTLLTPEGDPQYVSGSHANAINFNPVISFDGVNQYFTTSGNVDFNEVGYRSGSAFRIETIVVVNGSTTGSLIWGWQPWGMSPAGNKCGLDLGNAYMQGYNSLGAQLQWGAANANLVSTSPMILGYTGQSGGVLTNYVDLIPYSSAGNINVFDVNFLTAPFTIGCLDNSSAAGVNYLLNGRIAEIITYSSTLTASQRICIDSYLAVKYGITLGHNAASGGTRTNYTNTTGNVIWQSAALGDPMYNYHNNVTGVGREDNEGLHQRQSVSQNAVTGPAFQVTMGLGTIATDNASNPNSLTNSTYLLWGDDGADASSWMVDVTGSSPLLNRISRTWRVTETGSVGTMKIAIPSSAFGGETPTGVYLLTSTDATFDNNDTRTTMTLSGSNWQCSFNFSNQEYFTFSRTATTLPIALISFEVQCNGNKSLINWSTASEMNNDYFNIERSSNQFDFEIIGTIEGAGSSNQLIRYEWTDDFPLSGLNYYRLKQTDYDGQSEYSKIVSSYCENEEAVFSVYPNPATDQISVQTTVSGVVQIEILNCFGQLILEREIFREADLEEPITISIEALEKGLYLINISSRDTNFSSRFIK